MVYQVSGNSLAGSYGDGRSLNGEYKSGWNPTRRGVLHGVGRLSRSANFVAFSNSSNTLSENGSGVTAPPWTALRRELAGVS